MTENEKKNIPSSGKINSLVYLTESNYRQLIGCSDIKHYDFENAISLFKQLYDNWKFYKMFNKYDIKFLFKNFILLSGENENLFFKEVEDRKDNLGYILEIKGKLKYHLHPSCEGLNRGFRNFFMPEPVAKIQDKEEKIKVANEVRDWFKTNNYTIERYLNQEINDKHLTESFNRVFPNKFNIEPISISQSDQNQFKWYIQKKSDTIKIEKEFSFQEFENNVTAIISDRNDLCQRSMKLYNLSKHDNLIKEKDHNIMSILNERIETGYLKDVTIDYIENMGLDDLKTFWQKHIDLRNKGILEFTNFLKWKFNIKEYGLMNIKLENFNFECCTMCLMSQS